MCWLGAVYRPGRPGTGSFDFSATPENVVCIGTKYGRSRTSTRSFFVHHTQRIACAAQQYDARGIRKATALKKQELMKGHTGAP